MKKITIFAKQNTRRFLIDKTMDSNNREAFKKLVECGIKPSMQRLAIMQYLMTHDTHPTVEDVYKGLCADIPTLSRTTVYNTLRMLSEHKVAQMITIDDHRVCYDGIVSPHVHFFCKSCGKVINLFGQAAPKMPDSSMIEGCLVDEVQLYYKGLCEECGKRSLN